MLRALGPASGVTLPTVHFGMVFSTSCWYREPHDLPWIEYLHSGSGTIWYGVPESDSDKFCEAVERLCPAYRQNKSVWLPPDSIMIPPNILAELNVSISSVEQLPGEFVIVFPKSFFSSVSTGYTVSESVFFATKDWLSSAYQIFQNLRENCEPSLFALEQLLVNMSRDEHLPLNVLQQVHTQLSPIVLAELDYRQLLRENGIRTIYVAETQPHLQLRKRGGKRKNRRGDSPDLDEEWNLQDNQCAICSCALYFSKVEGLLSNNSSVCLRDALRLLKTSKNVNLKDRGLRIIIDEDELKEILAFLQSRMCFIKLQPLTR